MISTNICARPSPEFRERAHDLRNLFGAIASARHMFDDGPDETRRAMLLDAIEAAAHRGGALTTSLLAASPAAETRPLDLQAKLRNLEPLLRTMAGAGNTLSFDAGSGPALILGAPGRFDHIVLELVANARNALVVPGVIAVRLRSRRGTVRLIVADTGRGMRPEALRALLTQAPALGAHGTGFQQLRRFARDSYGVIRVRSAPGRGTVIVVDLPSLPNISQA